MARGSTQEILLGSNGEPSYLGAVSLSTTDATLTVPAGVQLLLQSDVPCYFAFGTAATSAQGVLMADGAPGTYVMTKHSSTVLHAIVASGTGTLNVFRVD